MTNDNADTRGDASASMEPRTLFDGFEAYLTVSDEEYLDIFRNGLVVLDTNMLHNLYRYAEHTRRDFIAALKEIRTQLWVPHQVVVEFWRNRDAAMRDKTASPQSIVTLVNDSYAQICTEVDGWAKRISLDPASLVKIKDDCRASLDSLIASLQAHGNDALNAGCDTNKDPVLIELTELLGGHVGKPLSEDDRRTAEAEGSRRIEDKAPPAYMDAKKPLERAIGDYLIWHQILLEASTREVDVLFVTGDVKEDWWRIDGGQTRGPRIELFNELKAHAGVKLRMLRPESFLYHANRLLAVKVDKNSILDAERVDEQRAATVDVVFPSSVRGGIAHPSEYPLYLTAATEELHDQYLAFLEQRYLRFFYSTHAGHDEGRIDVIRTQFGRGDVIIVTSIVRDASRKWARRVLDTFEAFVADRSETSDRRILKIVILPEVLLDTVTFIRTRYSDIIPVCRAGSQWASTHQAVSLGLASIATVDF